MLASNKSCTLKGVQKVFYFTTGDVASCCRAFPEKLSNYHSLDQLTSVWQQEQVEMAGDMRCQVVNHAGDWNARICNHCDNDGRAHGIWPVWKFQRQISAIKCVHTVRRGTAVSGRIQFNNMACSKTYQSQPRQI